MLSTPQLNNEPGTRPSNISLIGGTSCLWTVVVALISIGLSTLNVYELRRLKEHGLIVQNVIPATSPDRPLVPITSPNKPVYSVYGKSADDSHLKHVFAVMERLGFEHGSNKSTDWDILWAHDYPFRALQPLLRNLKPHQKVNHFPGCGYITNKVDLAMTELPYIPRAFRLPGDKDKLMVYAKMHPDTQFVQKSNSHRGVHVVSVAALDLDTPETFVQEYVDKPLLVDGYKFDIGVYTVVTSIDPLRVYIYNGDVLFRFCPQLYYPFDPAVLDKYVVGDDYLPIWDIPSLQKYYVNLGFSMKESFNAFVRSKGARTYLNLVREGEVHRVKPGKLPEMSPQYADIKGDHKNCKDPLNVWRQVEDAIRLICLKKESLLIESLSHYKYNHNFFEMVRFDFVIDEDLNVFVMEANMSPNLSSAHFPPNRLLYEQTLFNLFALVGVGRRVVAESLQSRSREDMLMQVAEKNLVVFPEECSKRRCELCLADECQLCLPCLTLETLDQLRRAYLEHINKLDCKRVVPPPMTPERGNISVNLGGLSPRNKLMYLWFRGKCQLDSSWCS
uniref:Tubulin-tyrosine ligase n=1 Tax=Timema bartmani TaxID=61472 RepID=A0A7R9F007_9NEOP|nr:unnamed protein product [Timema bartmani]